MEGGRKKRGILEEKKFIVKDRKNETCVREDGAVKAPGEKEQSWKASAGNAAFQEFRDEEYHRICKITECCSCKSPVRRKE